MNKRKEILKYCSSILFVGSFLCLSTIFIFLPNNKELVGALSYLNRIDMINIKNITEDLSLEYNYPISDIMGESTSGFEFNVENMSHDDSDINIVFSVGDIDDVTKLDNKAVKYILYKDKKVIKETSVLEENSIILTDKVNGNDYNNYTLKFWISDTTDADLEGKTFEPSITVDVVKLKLKLK